MGLSSMGTAEFTAPEMPVMDDRSSLRDNLRAIERRDWWLRVCAVLISLLRAAAIVSFGFPGLHLRHSDLNSIPLNDDILRLAGLVTLFDLYPSCERSA